MLPSMGSTSIPAVVPHFRPDGSRPQFRVTTGAGFGSPSPVIGLPVVVRSAFDVAVCAWARVPMFCVARRTAAPRPKMDNWTRDSAMAGSFVRADKTSQDVPRWVRNDQTFLTAGILNLAINARNAVPNGGRSRLVALETRERGKRGETHACWPLPIETSTEHSAESKGVICPIGLWRGRGCYLLNTLAQPKHDFGPFPRGCCFMTELLF